MSKFVNAGEARMYQGLRADCMGCARELCECEFRRGKLRELGKMGWIKARLGGTVLGLGVG